MEMSAALYPIASIGARMKLHVKNNCSSRRTEIDLRLSIDGGEYIGVILKVKVACCNMLAGHTENEGENARNMACRNVLSGYL